MSSKYQKVLRENICICHKYCVRSVNLTCIHIIVHQGYDDAEESPSLADLSSNNLTPESTRKDRHKKTSAHKRKDKKAKKVTFLQTNRVEAQNPMINLPACRPLQDMMVVDQSVFPVRTPDREGFLGPLSDLLEEEITLPGEEDQR